MQSYDATLFRRAAVPTSAAGSVVLVAASVAAGFDGGVGAVLGLGVVVAFFGFGLLVSRWTAASPPTTVMGLAMLSYLLKITLLALVLVLFHDTRLFSTGAFAAAVLVCTVVWLGAEVRAFTRVKMLYVDPAEGSEIQRR
jgi:ATP synthase protein I